MQVVAAPVQIQTRGLLFDMDGVLISSIGSVERCWKRWAKLYEVPDAENFRVPHGVRAKDVIRMLKPEFSEAEVAEGTRVIEDLEIDDRVDRRRPADPYAFSRPRCGRATSAKTACPIARRPS